MSMSMSIRAKTFLGILVTMALLTAAFGFSLRMFSQQNIQRVESHFGQQGLLRVENLLKEKQQDLETLVNSIAILDRLWHFSSSGEDRSLHKKYFASIPVDFILIFDNTQHLSYQFQQHRFENYSGNIQAELGSSVNLICSSDADRLKVRSGLVIFDHQPLLIAFRQINQLDGTDSPAGTLVMGLSLGDDFWTQVNEEWQMHGSLIHLNDEKYSDEKNYYYTSKTLNDLHGEPSFTLRSGNYRFIRSFSQHNLVLFLGLFAFSSVIIVFITQLILDKLVLARLITLGNSLEKVGNEEALDSQASVELEGDDEISALGDNINQMLSRLRAGDLLLSQQDQRFSDMIEHSGLVVVAIDYASRIILFNHAAEKATGYQREEVMNQNFFELFTSSETAELLGTYIAEAMATKEFSGDFHASLLIRDGSVREFLWDAIFEYNEHGDIENFIGFGRDVTEAKAIERRLKLINKVFENTAEAIVITDRDNRIVEVNQAFISMSGYSRSEVIGFNPSFLQSSHHDRTFFRAMWDELLRRGHWEGELWNRRKDGQEYVTWVTIDTIRDAEGTIKNFFSISSDISQIKDAEKQLHQLAYYDTLTQLPNRLSFIQQLDEHLLHCDEACNLAVMVLDLDSFKLVNESLGPVLADKLLQMFAERLVLCSSDAFLARIGGDEFALIARKQQVGHLVEDLFECMASPFIVEAQRVTLTTSVGVAVAPEDGETVSELLKNANTALYSIKELRRNSIQYYQQAMSDLVTERMTLAEMLRDALEHNEFELYYQPKIRLKDGVIVGAEALLRWHSRDGMIPPDRFIPIAEQTGLIIPIGEWVLKEACRQAKIWRQLNPDFHMGVNLSPAQFDLDYLPALVAEALQDCSLPAEALELEITEGMIIEDIEDTIKILNSLRDLGVELSIDDFGTGYSSLSYLTRLPLDILKIDRSFMEEVPHSRDSTNVVLSILALARSLNLKVTAEGVENQDHVTLLSDNRCTYIQGYFCSRPLPVADFEVFMQQRECRCINCQGITWNP